MAWGPTGLSSSVVVADVDGVVGVSVAVVVVVDGVGVVLAGSSVASIVGGGVGCGG